MSIEEERRTSGADTRRRILKTASALFAQRGFAGTSIRDISDELGLTKAALYYHFTSKEDILAELVTEPLTAMRAVMETPRDLTDREGRRQFIRDVVVATTSHDPDVVTVLKDPTVARLVGQTMVQSGAVNQLALRLAMGVTGVDDPQQVDPAKMIRSIAAVGAGYEAIINWHVVYPECIDVNSHDVDRVVDFVLAVLEGSDAPGA